MLINIHISPSSHWHSICTPHSVSTPLHENEEKADCTENKFHVELSENIALFQISVLRSLYFISEASHWRDM